MWQNLLENLEGVAPTPAFNLNDVPHKYYGEFSSLTVQECLNYIKLGVEENFSKNLIPIYGEYYKPISHMKCVLIDFTTGTFWETDKNNSAVGLDCRLYRDDKEELILSQLTIEHFAEGQKWCDAYETILEVVKFFKKTWD